MSLVKSLVIPAALALSLVATESRAELKTFESTEVRLIKAVATGICKDFQAGRGSIYLNKMLEAGQWAHETGATILSRSRVTSVQKKGANRWRCWMSLQVEYTPR